MKRILLLIPFVSLNLILFQSCNSNQKEVLDVIFPVDQHVQYEDKKAFKGEEYVNHLKLDEGYYLSKYDFTITINNEKLNNDAFSFENSTLIIQKQYVVSNIKIEGISTTFNGVPVTFDNDDKGSWTGDSHTTIGQDYVATISLKSSYRVKASTINININNETITQTCTLPDGTFYKNYDFVNDKLIIYKQAINGPIHISHFPFKIFTVIYTQESSVSHVKILFPSGSEFMKNTDVIIPVRVLDGYTIDPFRVHIVPQNSTKELVANLDFHASDTEITLYKRATSIGSLASYTITFNLGLPRPINTIGFKSLALYGLFSFYADEETERLIKPQIGCKLPNTIVVKKREGQSITILTQNVDYSYDNKTGKLILFQKATHNADEIFLEGEAVQTNVNIHLHGEHCTLEENNPIYEKDVSQYRSIPMDISAFVDDGYHFLEVNITTTDGYVMPGVTAVRDETNPRKYTIHLPSEYLMADLNINFVAIKQ